LHGEGLTGSCHTVGKHRSMVPLHDPSDKAFGPGVVHLGIVVMSRENIICLAVSMYETRENLVAHTIIVVSSIFPSM
jgi:hypothetical protein